MVLRGESANLLSVGAIDFGLIVDASVIMMENIFRRVAEGGNGTPLALATAPPGLPERLKTHYFRGWKWPVQSSSLPRSSL